MTEMGGALAGALAKAQGSFPAITKDKQVTVHTKTGKDYSFKYAPLDSILDAVRKPLADNGLVVVQMLDDGGLTTMLLHESGERLGGTVAVPFGDDIQGFGSAITYMRRYAIQALLGIAAEDDDDGNRAAGNRYTESDRKEPITRTEDGGLIGEVAVGKSPVDMQLRQTPDGAAWGFKLTSGGKGYQALAVGPLADALAVSGLKAKDRVIVWGNIVMIPWQKDGKDMPPYARIAIERIQAPEWTLPSVAAPGPDVEAPVPVAPGQEAFDLSPEALA